MDHPTTQIWDTVRRQVLFTLPGVVISSYWGDQTLTFVTSTPDRKGSVYTLWDVASRQAGRPIASVTLPIVTPQGFSFTQNFTFIATESPSPTLWDLRTGQQVDAPPLRSLSPITTVTLSPDGQRLSVYDPSLGERVYDTTTWQELFQKLGSDFCCSLDFSPDSRWILTSQTDDWTKIWDATTGSLLYTFPFAGTVGSAAVSPDDKLLVTSSDQKIIVWDIASGQQVQQFAPPGDGLIVPRFSPDDTHLLAMGYSGKSYLWNLTPGTEWVSMVNGDPINFGPTIFNQHVSLAYSPDGKRLITTNQDESAILWNPTTGQRLQTLTGPGQRNWIAALSPDGKRVVVGGNCSDVKVLDANTGAEIQTISLGSGWPMSAAWSPDGTQIAICTQGPDNAILLWNSTTDQQRVLKVQSALTTIVFSPDGTRIAAGGNFTGGIWDVGSAQEVLALNGGLTRINDLVFSPDGKRLVSAGYKHDVQIWNAATGDLLQTLSSHTEAVTGVAYSPDGSQIASSSFDGTVRLWDAQTGKLLLTLDGAAQGVGAVAFSPDGTRLAAENYDGTTRVYVLPIPDLIALAQSRLTRTLTTAECQRYLHTDSCPASGA